MSNETANNRINNLWERAALFFLTAALSLTVWAFQEQGKKVEALEQRVLVIQTSKVDKADLRDVEDRINSKIDGMKSDLIARLDLYFGKLSKP